MQAIVKQPEMDFLTNQALESATERAPTLAIPTMPTYAPVLPQLKLPTAPAFNQDAMDTS
jgi:hypothetical protein